MPDETARPLAPPGTPSPRRIGTQQLASRVEVLERLGIAHTGRLDDHEGRLGGQEVRIGTLEADRTAYGEIKVKLEEIKARLDKRDEADKAVDDARLEAEMERREEAARLNARLKAIAPIGLLILSTTLGNAISRWNGAIATIVIVAAIAVAGLGWAYIALRDAGNPPGGRTP